MTFVLGLVAEPPAAQYVYQPDSAAEGDRRRAADAGPVQLRRLPHAGDGAVRVRLRSELPRVRHGRRRSPRTSTTSSARTSRPSEIKAVASRPIAAAWGMPRSRPRRDRRARRSAGAGRRRRSRTSCCSSSRSGSRRVDQRPAVAGRRAGAGAQALDHQASSARRRRPGPADTSRGAGRAAASEPQRQVRRRLGLAAAAAGRAKGRKVQTDWLHDFLLDPYPIRPAVVLRMPKFNMSSAEASKLANYFAAVDGRAVSLRVRPPHARQPPGRRPKSQFPGRLEDALRIVTNGNFCVKCHKLGDYVPQGSEQRHGAAAGPGLSPAAAGVPGSLARPTPSGCCPTRACR